MASKKCECKTSFIEGLIAYGVIVSYLLLPIFIYKVSKRSKQTIVMPKFITFRIYGGSVSSIQIISTALWSYGIPTHFIGCFFLKEKQKDECIEFIETTIVVPSTRAFQADVLLRQHFNATFNQSVVVSKPEHTNTGIPSTQYANRPPMRPRGIPFKPIMFYDVILSFIFQSQLNKGMAKRKSTKRTNPVKRTKTVKLWS